MVLPSLQHSSSSSRSFPKMKFTVVISALLAPSLVLGLLDVKMKAKGRKYIGAAADPNTISDSTCKTILTSDFGCVTPENSMKWDATERELLDPGLLCMWVLRTWGDSKPWQLQFHQCRLAGQLCDQQ
jgi:hypothetical protein